MRRLAILGIGGALWLLLGVVPALADGGPHVMSYNNGSPTPGVTEIRADACAGCHRIHTSQSPTGYLLVGNDATVTDFCRSCHGATGTGASTDVDTGVQYAIGGIESDATMIGALRGGGFVQARIGSDSAYRLVSSTGSVSNSKVPVAANLAPQPVTSAHLALGPIAEGGNGLTAKNIVWGNKALGTAGAGPTLAAEMECTACHNPHGNGNYRILEGIPEAGAAQELAATAVNVSDATYDPNRTRNYTVIEIAGTKPAGSIPTPAEEATWLLYADQLTGYSPFSGDYLHKTLPYNTPTSGTPTPVYPFDAPNGRPNYSNSSATGWGRDDPNGFNVQMTNWCAQCHTRYLAPSGSRSSNAKTIATSSVGNPTVITTTAAHGFVTGNKVTISGHAGSTPTINGTWIVTVTSTTTFTIPVNVTVAGTGGTVYKVVDDIYTFRHTTARNRTCNTCHVAHGTNAVMDADLTTPTPDGYSANVPWPGSNGTTVGDSRLLKVDNRGTCQLCHDPTNGSAAKQPTVGIATVSIGNPAVITTTAAHNLVTGDQATISGVTGATSTPAINGTFTVTVTGPTTFTVPVDVTVAGTGGTVSKYILLPQGLAPAFFP